ncbi:MAG: histidine phosphatase family protein [Gemmatimonadota bacterium]
MIARAVLVVRASLLALAVQACATAPSRNGAEGDSRGSAPVVVLVRHAEKAPLPANDPVLSTAGMMRAGALDAELRDMPIRDVVVSHLQRTRLTASVVIARAQPVVHVVPIGAGGAAAHIRAVADTVRAIAKQRGQGGILVVGHSNTVTQIVGALGAGTLPELCDSQYSQLFRVTLPNTGSPTLARSVYGAPDPSDPSCAASAPGMLQRP